MSSMPQFAAAFGCKEKQPMVRPDTRLIWQVWCENYSVLDFEIKKKI